MNLRCGLLPPRLTSRRAAARDTSASKSESNRLRLGANSGHLGRSLRKFVIDVQVVLICISIQNGLVEDEPSQNVEDRTRRKGSSAILAGPGDHP